MKNLLLFRCLSFVVLFTVGSGIARASDNPLAEKLVGKWKQEMIGARTGGAIINITAVDATGRISGKYIPPSGPAGGQEFDVIGWISSAAAQEKADNVITVSFTVSLSTYGSISSETGYLRDNKIFAMWHNVRPNTAYDWAHIATGEDVWTKVP
jgi:Avidin family